MFSFPHFPRFLFPFFNSSRFLSSLRFSPICSAKRPISLGFPQDLWSVSSVSESHAKSKSSELLFRTLFFVNINYISLFTESKQRKWETVLGWVTVVENGRARRSISVWISKVVMTLFHGKYIYFILRACMYYKRVCPRTYVGYVQPYTHAYSHILPTRHPRVHHSQHMQTTLYICWVTFSVC